MAGVCTGKSRPHVKSCPQVPITEAGLSVSLKNNVSRTQYAEHIQLLRALGSSDVNKLPDTVDTLKRQVLESMPTIKMWATKDLALNPKKLSSSRRITSMMAGENPTQDLFFLDTIDLFRRIAASDLSKKMHHGIAHLVDNPTEVWHSMQWASSIRTTSGDFTFYRPSHHHHDAAPCCPMRSFSGTGPAPFAVRSLTIVQEMERPGHQDEPSQP